MLGPVREFVRTLVVLAETRARLAANELEEQTLCLLEIAVWTVLSMFFFGVAVVFLAVLIVLLAWDANRVLAAGLLTALFLGTGTFGAFMAARLLKLRPKLFAATLAELAKDRERIERGTGTET
jgi:uncharacterized membrane protein YqjE